MRALRFVQLMLSMVLIGAAILSASADFTKEKREELAHSLKKIDDHLRGVDGSLKSKREHWNVRIYEDMIEASRRFIGNTANAAERKELARAMDLLEKLPWARYSCSRQAEELLNELAALSNRVELPILSEFFRDYKEINDDEC